jgi:hypothetical protein
VLRNLNKGESQEEAVAALSEENRGAVVLAAFKMGHTLQSQPSDDQSSSENKEEEEDVDDVHAASSLLFLQRTATTEDIPEDTKVPAVASTTETTVPSPVAEPLQATPPIHQSCAASVPKQSGAKSNSYYFI